MPLRDHFRPPVSQRASWEGILGLWPAVMVQELSRVLPGEYSVEPRVHLGSSFEIDVCAYEHDNPGPDSPTSGAGTLTLAPQPTRVAEVELTEEYAYEVLIFDHSRGRQLVAAVELVSPANKDRPESRRAFVAKCAALLQNRVCLSIVDLVTTRQFNLYCELMDFAGNPDEKFADAAPSTYAVTCRGRRLNDKPRLEIWSYPLIVGQPLPALPIWLNDSSSVSLDLEATYETSCRTLRIA